MTESMQFQENNQSSEQLRNLSFVERHNIHPFLFAGVVLFVVFVLYQFGGGLLTIGISLLLQLPLINPSVLRLAAAFGQILFILIPTLFFATLLSKNVRTVFPLKIPSVKESTFALLSLLSLQWMFEIYKAMQELIPVPRFLEEILQPWKELILEMTKKIATADSFPELLFVLLVVAVLPSMIEEVLFRGLIQRTFEYVLSPFIAAVLSGALFGIFHLNPFDLVPLVAIGIFLALLRFRSQTLLLPVAAHFLNNAIAIFALYMGYDDESMVAGSASSIPLLLFQLVMVGGIFFIAFRQYLKATR